MVSHEEQNGVEDLSLLHPDPVVLELNRLKNLLKGSQSSLISFSTEWCQVCFCIHEACRVCDELVLASWFCYYAPLISVH